MQVPILCNFKYKGLIRVSAFAYAPIFKQSKLVFRYDYFEPNTKGIDDVRGSALAAYVYSPNQNFQISPNLLIESYGKVGGQSVAPSVWARLTFNWSIL